MTNIEKNFERSLELYHSKRSSLPLKIYWKLDLILYMIHGNLPNKDLLSLQQQMQFQDLQNLDMQSLKIVFNNIIDTLFTKEVIKHTKCQIKKRGLFSSWINATILHDNQNFLITYSHKTYNFEKNACEIKKNRQSKRALQLYFQGSHKYTIKFQNQSEMKTILKQWVKEIIDVKNQKNYQEMKTLVEIDNNSFFMSKINLFDFQHKKKAFSPQNLSSFSPQPIPLKKMLSQFDLDTKFAGNTDVKKKRVANETITLKPVPHGYIQKLKNQRLIIALSRDDKAKIYIEHIFEGKFQQQHLLCMLLLQKSWNSYLLLEEIQKSKESLTEIYIYRKYDSLKEIGHQAQVNLKAAYTSWSSKTSMIVIQSVEEQDQKLFLNSKCIITLEAYNDKVRILIQDELDSQNQQSDTLKKVLFEMYREIAKLQLIHEQIVFNNFEAETLIANMLEDDQSTNAESMDDISTLPVPKRPYIITNQTEQVQLKPCQTNQSIKKLPDTTVLRLKSPLQYPNPDYIEMARCKMFERNYFRFYFSQEQLEKYDDYVPYYRLDKMLEGNIYEITPSRELKFIDQELLDSQKETLRFVLRQIGANLISGKSVLNVSLPVDIFQSRTGLERSAASFACCPDYLLPMAQSPAIEQMTNTVGFILNVISCELVMQKPFNPILGQTFQGYIKGIPIYYEQTSHNPPVSSYFMKCAEFTLYGNLLPFADVGLNTGVGGNLGPMNIIFENGSHFECYFPPSQIAGLIYGDRKFRCYNKGFIFEKSKQLFAEFSIQNQKKGVYESATKLKSGQIIGGIYKVRKQFIEQVQKYRKHNKNLKKFTGLNKQAIIEKYHSISGEWFMNILIDSKAINTNKNVYPVEYAKNVLPSDSNHRLDVLYHKIKDLTHSQKEKQILQNIQRNDKKLREKYKHPAHSNTSTSKNPKQI